VYKVYIVVYLDLLIIDFGHRFFQLWSALGWRVADMVGGGLRLTGASLLQLSAGQLLGAD